MMAAVDEELGKKVTFLECNLSYNPNDYRLAKDKLLSDFVVTVKNRVPNSKYS